MNLLLFLLLILLILFACLNLPNTIILWVNEDISLTLYILYRYTVYCISFNFIYIDFLDLICIDLISSDLDFPFVNRAKGVSNEKSAASKFENKRDWIAIIKNIVRWLVIFFLFPDIVCDFFLLLPALVFVVFHFPDTNFWVETDCDYYHGCFLMLFGEKRSWVYIAWVI